MGKDKTTGTTVVNQTQKATPTAEETELNKLQLEQAKAAQPQVLETQNLSYNLINKLLTGSTDLPGFFGQLGQGIDENMTGQIVQNSLKDLYPQFQSQGIMDSGTSQSIAARTAGDIRTGVAEYNLGNKFNLLNLAFGGQAQVQQPTLATSQMLGSRLAGLRSINTQGTTNTTTKAMNPFIKSFQMSAGQGLGNWFDPNSYANLIGAAK